MKSRQKGNKMGFTLIELSFAIAFISVLLITVALITNEIISVYRKGYAIKNVNQIGRDLIDEFQNTISQAPPNSLSSICAQNYSSDPSALNACNENSGFYSFYQQYYALATVRNGDSEKYYPTGGIFCTGRHTYIWNTGYLFNTDGTYTFAGSQTQDDLKLKVVYNSGIEKKNFRLLKIEDGGGNICKSTLNGSSYPSTSTPLRSPGSNNAGDMTITIPNQLTNEPEELLADSDSGLALFDFVVFEPARVAKTNRLLFSGSFILATITGGVDIMTASNYCKAPSNFTADFNYCAINKFNFTIQASGS